jgi:nucleoside-diphosphate-sugar epimerase
VTTLVTGASGLVGSHLVEELKNRHQKVVSLIYGSTRGRFVREALKGTKKEFADVRDYLELKRIMARNYVDKVYHLAALCEVKSAYKDPLSVYDVNVMGAAAVLEAARDVGVEKVSILITDKVYGEKLLASEISRLQPSEPYATSKICQQLIAESYRETFGMNVVMPHSCNIFGYDPFANRIFPNVIKKCIRGRSPQIWQNDESIREYIHVTDVVRALYNLMEGDYEGSYNISTGWVYDNHRIVEAILEHFPKITPVFTTTNVPLQIQKQTMKSIRWKFKPALSMDDAIDMTIKDFIKYEEDWK